MSMIQELIAAVTNAERQIDDQIMKLNSYKSEIEQVTQKVDAAFGGGTDQYGQQMIQQLSLTRKQVDDTINRLRLAKDKLIQVRMV